MSYLFLAARANAHNRIYERKVVNQFIQSIGRAMCFSVQMGCDVECRKAGRCAGWPSMAYFEAAKAALREVSAPSDAMLARGAAMIHRWRSGFATGDDETMAHDILQAMMDEALT